MNNNLIYAVIACIVLGSLIWRGMPFINGVIRFCKSMFGKIHLNKKSDLTAEQYRKLALGALYSEQKGAYINSLNTGIDKAYLRKLLSEGWDTNDRDEAIDTLTYLQKKGYRFHFPAVVEALKVPEDQQESVIVSAFDNDEDREKAYYQLRHLKESLEELKETGVIEADIDVAKYGSAGWDCGRLVFLARICYDIGFITEEEAWKAIESAADFSKRSFSSWKDYANSYIIGRALWGGANSYNGTIIDISKYLLVDPKSPWVRLSW